MSLWVSHIFIQPHRPILPLTGFINIYIRQHILWLVIPPRKSFLRFSKDRKINIFIWQHTFTNIITYPGRLARDFQKTKRSLSIIISIIIIYVGYNYFFSPIRCTLALFSALIWFEQNGLKLIQIDKLTQTHHLGCSAFEWQHLGSSASE